MTAFRLNVEAEEFARVMTNALAFFPARSQIKTAQLVVYPDRITATGTDAYTIGRDSCAAWNWQSQEADIPVHIEIDRDGWREIEAQARKDKKSTGTLDYLPGDCLTYRPGGDKAEIATAQDMTGKPWPNSVGGLSGIDFWDECAALLQRLDEPSDAIPGVMAFDPQYFGRFQKVKTPKEFDGEKILSFAYQGQSEPMLAKVGPSFVGAIMPIDLETYRENQPEEAEANTWN